MKSIVKIIKNEYIFSILTKVFTILIGMAQSVLVARYLGAALQGTSSYIISIVSIGSIIITFGMHQVYPYLRKNKERENIDRDFMSIIYMLFSVYMLIALFAVCLIVESVELKVVILLIPLYGYGRVVAYLCLIENPNKRNSVWTIIGIIEIAYVILIALFIEKSFYVAISILVFAELLRSVVYTGILRIKPSYNKELLSLVIQLFKYGFLPMLALLMTTLNYKVDILMLRSFDFITESEIGVYSIGIAFADKIVLIPDTLKGVLISKLAKGGNEEEVAKVSRICFVSSLLLSIVFCVFGKIIINVFYGPEYVEAYQILFTCAAGTIFIGYFKLIAQYNIVNKKQIRNVALLSVSVVINVLLNLILIPKYSYIGAAIASAVGYFLSGIIFVIWFAKQNNIAIRKMFILQKSDFNYFIRSK